MCTTSISIGFDCIILRNHRHTSHSNGSPQPLLLDLELLVYDGAVWSVLCTLVAACRRRRRGTDLFTHRSGSLFSGDVAPPAEDLKVTPHMLHITQSTV